MIVNEKNTKNDCDILYMNYSKKEKIVNIVLSIFESIPTILTHLPHNTFAFDINPTRIATNNKCPPPLLQELIVCNIINYQKDKKYIKILMSLLEVVQIVTPNTEAGSCGFPP